MSEQPRLAVSAEQLAKMRAAVSAAKDKPAPAPERAAESRAPATAEGSSSAPGPMPEGSGGRRRGVGLVVVGLVMVLAGVGGVVGWLSLGGTAEDVSTSTTTTSTEPVTTTTVARQPVAAATSSSVWTGVASIETTSTTGAQAIASTTTEGAPTTAVDQPLRLTAIYGPPPEDGGEYALTVTVTNTGETTVAIPDDGFSLLAGELSLAPSADEIAGLEIEAGDQVSGLVSFEVPSELGRATLALRTGAGEIRFVL